MFVGVAARLGETRAVLCDQLGKVIKVWNELPPLQEELIYSWCATEERENELQQWINGFSGRTFTCTWADATLAGAFSGQPGILLATEHWTLYSGCGSQALNANNHDSENTGCCSGNTGCGSGNTCSCSGNTACCSSGSACCSPTGAVAVCQALALAREANHRTLSILNGEGGLEWMARESLKLLAEVQGPSKHRLHRALAPHNTYPTDREAIRTRALAIRNHVEDLANYPGPDPACLALLSKTARRLSDLLRRLTSQARLHKPVRATWLDGTMQGPLWEAMQVEFQKYLPELLWQKPDNWPEVGAALLALGAIKEEERRAMNPAGPGKAISDRLEADAWRQLSRIKL